MSPAALILELDTVGGGADLLIADLRAAGLQPETVPGLDTVVRLSLPVEDLPSTCPTSIQPTLHGDATTDATRAELDRSAAILRQLLQQRGFTSAAVRLPGAPGETAFDAEVRRVVELLHRAGLAAGHGFRVGCRDSNRRELLIAQVAAATGWRSDASDWVINFEEAGPDAGQRSWLVQLGPLHWSRRSGRLQRLPWSTPGALADFLVRLAKLRAGQSLLDPCCGSGTILVAGGLCGAGRILGIDHDQDAVRIARNNLAAVDVHGSIRLGDWLDGQPASELRPGSVDRVISNLPFGKQVGSHQGNRSLYPTLLTEIARMLAPDGRAVLLTEDKRLFTDTVQRTRGIKIIKERTFRYSGATPSAYVISRRR